jgi:hypothetical protein
MIVARPLPRGMPAESSDPSGLAPRVGSSASEGTSVLSSIATVRAGGVRRASGGAASRLGTKSSGPPGDPFHDKEVSRSWSSRPLASQHAKLARCLRPVRQAPSRRQPRSPGCFTAPAESRCRTAHSRRVRSHRRWKDAKASVHVRSSRSRCARVPRWLQKLTGDARFKKRLSVAAERRGRNLASGGKNRHGRNSGREASFGGKRCRTARKGPRRAPLWVEGVSGSSKPKPNHTGWRWQRSRPIARSSALGLCGLRAATETSEVEVSRHASAGRQHSLGRRSKGRSGRSPCAWHRPPVSSRAPSIPNPETTRKLRVLVFDMWIAYVDQTHLWLVGPAASKDT